MPVDGVPKHLVRSLSRAKFEQLVDSLVKRSIEPCMSALKAAGLDKGDIDEVILVGLHPHPCCAGRGEGVLRQGALEGCEPRRSGGRGCRHPRRCLDWRREGRVAPLGRDAFVLGIETMGGVFTKLIDANTTIPTKKSRRSPPPATTSQAWKSTCSKASAAMAADKTIGRFHLADILPAPRGVPQIEVTFDIDANGIINVGAKDKATGKEQSIKIEASSGSARTKSRMKADAEANADADAQAKERVDVLNQADGMVFQTEKQLKEFGDKIPADKMAPINEALENLKKAHGAQDVDGCKSGRRP